MGMEVITTTDKDQRDRMFDDLRKNGNRLERQVVKFSSVETVMVEDSVSGKAVPTYRSTYSVAYPNGKVN